jgi:hypothetical protein
MFTDDAVTPVRLEILVDLLRECRQGLTREEAYRLLQPEPLKPDPKFAPARATIRAGLELQVIEEDQGGKLSLTIHCRKQSETRSAILSAFDKLVLRSTHVEKYFALFYSYYLGLGKRVYEMQNLSREEWAIEFNKVAFNNVPQVNRFNEPKHKGLEAWFGYVGLGWFDPRGSFQANPYDRLLRTLPELFGRQRKLDADGFVTKLGATCPELDGGEFFSQTNREWQSSERKCSLGLSHALIELHLDGVVRLNCPADSAGWSVGEAEPPSDENFRSDRFAAIELLARA